MAKFTKVLSIIIFKRFFEKYPFILFYPRLADKKKSLLQSYIILQKYILLYAYNFKLHNFNYSNLIMFYFNIKLDFIFKFKNSLNKVYGLKFNNIFFDSVFLNKYKNLFFFFKKKIFIIITRNIFAYIKIYIFVFTFFKIKFNFI